MHFISHSRTQWNQTLHSFSCGVDAHRWRTVTALATVSFPFPFGVNVEFHFHPWVFHHGSTVLWRSSCQSSDWQMGRKGSSLILPLLLLFSQGEHRELRWPHVPETLKWIAAAVAALIMSCSLIHLLLVLSHTASFSVGYLITASEYVVRKTQKGDPTRAVGMIWVKRLTCFTAQSSLFNATRCHLNCFFIHLVVRDKWA